MWALRLRPSFMWFRSTLPDFPLMGASRFGAQPYVTPRPNKRAEIFIFGGHLEATGGARPAIEHGTSASAPLLPRRCCRAAAAANVL